MDFENINSRVKIVEYYRLVINTDHDQVSTRRLYQFNGDYPHVKEWYKHAPVLKSNTRKIELEVFRITNGLTDEYLIRTKNQTTIEYSLPKHLTLLLLRSTLITKLNNCVVYEVYN